MGILKNTIALALAAVAIPVVASAGPWTPERGHGQIIFTLSTYSTREVFDQSGRRLRFDFDGRFRKVELNPYLELGITDRATFLASTFVPRSEFSNQFGAESNAGLGDSTIGVRYRFTGTTGRVLAAAQGLVKLPTAGRGQPNLGNRQTDLDGRLVVGGPIGKSSRPPFWTAEGGFRYRAEGPADELKLEGTIGAYVHPRVMVMGQFAGTKGLKNNDQALAGLDPTLSPDYDLTRGQASVVFSIAPRSRLQVGAFAHLTGRNTGAGSGALVSFWQSF